MGKGWSVLAALLALCVSASFGLQCVSESGSNVDWWIIYKLPVISSSSDPTAQSGFGYAYMDATSSSTEGLKVTELQLNTNTKGALGATLAPIYSGSSSSVAYLSYNDQWPGTSSSGSSSSKSSYGHTKGVVAFDKNEGFWLVHSTPRFPNYKADGYDFPADEATYGQTFLCVTYGLSTLNDILYTMVLNHPAVYDSGGSSSLTKLVPNFSLITGDAHNNTTPYGVALDVSSYGSHSFVMFAKNAVWDMDLYESLVGPTLKTDLYCETWMRPVEPSNCRPKSPYDVMNVVTVAFNNKTGIVFSETDDHSKWCVGTTASLDWVCIGDINRQTSQWNRAGGTVCFKNKYVWDSFNYILEAHNDCGSSFFAL